MTKRIVILLFLAGCAPQLDYFGNPIKLHEDIISLTKMRKDPSEKDITNLIFYLLELIVCGVILGFIEKL